MGPPQAEQALREALAMGADEAILISDRAFAGSDTLATSYTLARAINKIGDYDLVLCGKQAFDGDTAQVGPGLAEVVETPLPALITCVKQMNEPRHAGLRGVMKARKAQIPTWTAQDIEADVERCGLTGSPTNVIRVFPPQRHRAGEKLEGDVEQVVQTLISKLREAKVL